MRIDYTLQSGCKYLFMDAPFRYGARHLKVACRPDRDQDNKSKVSLIERVGHGLIGGLLILPVVGLIIAVALRIFQHCTCQSGKKESIRVSGNTPSIVSSGNPLQTVVKPIIPLEGKKTETQSAVETNTKHEAPESSIDASKKTANNQHLPPVEIQNNTPEMQSPKEKTPNIPGKTEKTPNVLPVEKTEKTPNVLPVEKTEKTSNVHPVEKTEKTSNVQPVQKTEKTPEILPKVEKSQKQQTVAQSPKIEPKTQKELNSLLLEAFDNNDLKAALELIPQIEKKFLNKQGDKGSYLFLIVRKFKKEEFDIADAAKLMKALLKQGADPNIGKNDKTPFYSLCQSQEDGWEKLATILLNNSANPCLPYNDDIAFTFLRHLPDSNSVKARLLKDWKFEIEDYILSQNVTTLWGVEIKKKVEGVKVMLDGGNESDHIYNLLEEAFDNYIKENDFDFPHQEGVAQLTKEEFIEKGRHIIKFAQEILFTPKRKFKEVVDKIKKSDLPVLFPTGWKGHAASIVMRKNLIMRCNLNVESKAGLIMNKFRINKFNDVVFKKITVNPKLDDQATKKYFYKGIEADLGITSTEDHFFQMEAQQYSNCTWASSAFLGFTTAVFLLGIRNSDLETLDSETLEFVSTSFVETVKFCRALENFTQYYTVKKYIENIKRAERKDPDAQLEFSKPLLKAILEKCPKGEEKEGEVDYLIKARKLIERCLRS